MRKSTFLVLILFSFLVTICTPFALATAILPEPQGLVTDPIGLFSEEEAQRIRDQGAGQTFELVVLTAEGLSEQEGESFAQQAYDAWDLAKDQLMLVITVDPNYVHLVFDHAELKNRVAQTKLRNAQGIIEASFVPLAQEGKVAEGVLAVSELVNSLELGSTASSNPTTTTSNSTQPVKNEIASPNVQGASAVGKQTNLAAILFSLVLMVVLICLAFYSVRRFIKLKQTKQSLSEIKMIVDQAAPQVNRMLASELFKEWEQGFLQGETATFLGRLEQILLKVHQQSSQLNEQLAQQRITYFSSLPMIKEKLEQLRLNAQEWQQEVDLLHEQWLQVERAAKEVGSLINEVKIKSSKVTEDLGRLALQTNYPLSELKENVREALDRLEHADQIDEFDVLGGQKSALEAEQQLATIQADILELEKQLRQFSELPLRIQKQEEHIREWVTREQLLLIDADPYVILTQTEPLLKKVEQLLQTGDVHQAGHTLQQLNEILDQAQAAVQEMVSNRNQTLETVQSAEQLLEELNSFDQAFEEEMEQLQREFVEEAYQEQYVRYAQIKQDQEALRSSLPNIKALADVRVQKYQEAYQQAQQASTLIKRLEATRAHSLTLYQQLVEELKQIGQQFSAAKGEFYQALALYEQSGLAIVSFTEELRQGEKGIADFEQLSTVRPADVALLASRYRQLQTVLDSLLQKVVQLVKAKKEGEEHYRALNQEFEQSLRRYGSKISVKKYVTSFQQVQRELEELLRAGRFSEVNGRIAQGKSIMQQMEQEYRRRLRTERRGGGSGPFIGGGGGRSSGGSGWGNGRSSGSSSWGGSSP